MAKHKKYTPEQIVQLLRDMEIEQGKGLSQDDACRKVGITVQTFYRWRKDFGGMKTDQARRLRELEQENLKLKRVVADLVLDNSIRRIPTSSLPMATMDFQKKRSTPST